MTTKAGKVCKKGALPAQTHVDDPRTAPVAKGTVGLT